MGFYEGKEPCAGCGRTGIERARISKNQLCPECMRLLAKARLHEAEHKEYSRVFLTWYSFYNHKLNGLVNNFLDKISTPEASSVEHSKRIRLGHVARCTSSNMNFVPTFVAEALEELMRGIQEEGILIARREDDLLRKAEAEAAANKQKYYEEGVRYGRQMLAQLNRGEITLQDFNAIPNKYLKENEHNK